MNLPVYLAAYCALVILGRFSPGLLAPLWGYLHRSVMVRRVLPFLLVVGTAAYCTTGRGGALWDEFLLVALFYGHLSTVCPESV